jgi:thiamine monophosphate kinase
MHEQSIGVDKMKEYELISSLFGDISGLFESDAQIIEIGGQKYGITCDTFSFEEDMFTDDDPLLLGHNLVAATVSDLTASGCAPAFFMHSITFANNGPTADYQWMKTLTEGISSALKSINCVLIGGDTGQAQSFSYTGIAIGSQIKSVSRIFPNIAQHLYVSGNLGDANEAILKSQSTPEFELRPMPKRMLACIDTSGGFADALWQLHELNPQFRIDVKDPPTNDIRMLFGGAGEYELLYTAADASHETEDAILVGTVTPGEKGLFLNGAEIKNSPPDPRSSSLTEYIGALEKYVYEIFG